VLRAGISFWIRRRRCWTRWWRAGRFQQRARGLKRATIRSRVELVRRFVGFSNQYPWHWNAAEVEAFFAHLMSGAKPIAVSTARQYQTDLRLFLDYVTDRRYGWPRECEQRFGQAPVQLLHEWNSVVHVNAYEGAAGRRPLTYDEVQALFDAADAMVEQIRGQGRKGGLAAHRDAVLLKTIYAFGLRRSEAWGLDVQDWGRNPKAARFGGFGCVNVRHGKSSRGSPPKRRTVLTVPEMDWAVDLLQQWMTDIRPQFGPAAHPAMWVTERRGRLSRRSINEAFTEARDAAGLSADLDLHCLRHAYVTHLVEFGYPAKFVQDQVGHDHASTTAIYTGVSDEYRTRLVQASLHRRLQRLEETEP
jgi:site-specific recombinase XerD